MAKVLVTSKYCGGCSQAKNLLRKRGIKFREVDADTKSGDKFCDKHSIRTVPTMIIDGKKTNNIDKWFK